MKAFFGGIWKFFKDQSTDSNGLWDSKLIFGNAFLIFSIVYISHVKPGDSVGFLAISGIGAFLHGWAASPWGGSSPNTTGKNPNGI